MINGYSAECIFCDDIRQEAGDKYSCMGIYTSEVLLDSLPRTLPMFSVVVFLSSPATNIFTNVKVVLDIFGKEQVHDISEDDINEFKNDIAQQLTRYNDIERALMTAQFTLAPLSVPDTGSIGVRVNVDGCEIPAGKIRFVLKHRADPGGCSSTAIPSEGD
jgi:hypothetical protein